MQAYLDQRGHGPGGREANSEVEARCKANLASLVSGAPENIALVSNASEAINAVAQSLSFEPGDNVVINTLEFPCGVLPWLALRARGVEVRVVEHDGWEVEPAAILRCVDDRTRLVMTSHVSYLSGARQDYAALYAHLKATRALLLVDVTQSVGVVPVDIRHADIMVSSSYKWLLGIHGAGVLAVNPARTAGMVSRPIGWRSVGDIFTPDRFSHFTRHTDARQFELGYPSYAAIYALEFSTGLLLETGIANIERHVLALGDELISSLGERGFEVMTPQPAERRAGNIAVVCPQGEAVAGALRDENILVWGGDGRVRASVHAFNDSGDIERYVAAMAKRHAH